MVTISPSPVPEKYLLSFKEFEDLLEQGVLATDKRVELIRGELFAMTPIDTAHISIVAKLTKRLVLSYHKEAYVMVQSSLQLPPNSEPQPDLMLLSLPEERYDERKPQASDAYLVIEVSDSTLAYDTGKKLDLYAEASIPEVWIRNLKEDTLEVFRDPKNGKYRTHLSYLRGESVTPLFLTTASKTAFDWSLICA